MQKPYLQRLIKDATVTSQLWEEASKRLPGWEDAVVRLHKIGYTIRELASGTRIARVKIRRALDSSRI